MDDFIELPELTEEDERILDQIINRMYFSLDRYFESCVDQEKNHFTFLEKEFEIMTNCPICYDCENTSIYVKTNCNHSFCVPCMKTMLDRNHSLDCPMCRCKITQLITNDVNAK